MSTTPCSAVPRCTGSPVAWPPRDYFTTRDMVRFAWSQLKFRVLATEVASDMSHARSAALSFVNGWPVKKLETLSEEIFDELMAERIWSGHARARPAPPRRRPARLAGDRGTDRARSGHRRSARPHRCTRDDRRKPPTVSTPDGWSAICCTDPRRRPRSKSWPRSTGSTC